MTVWIIIKQLIEKRVIKRTEIVEACPSDVEAAKFAKLYNLQIPVDMRDKMVFNYVCSKLA